MASCDRRTGIALVLAALAANGACNTTLTGYPFAIRALYAAPISGLRIEVLTSGHVPAGADLSDGGTGIAQVCPLGGAGRPLSLRLDGSWNRRDVEASLREKLLQAGYAPDAQELAEIVEVIGAALSGPKAVHLEGQTRELEVLAVEIQRRGLSAPTQPEACARQGP